ANHRFWLGFDKPEITPPLIPTKLATPPTPPMERAEWRALKVLADLVNLYSYDEKRKVTDTRLYSANARAVRLLTEHRLIEIEYEGGRWVRGKWTQAGQKLLEADWDF